MKKALIILVVIIATQLIIYEAFGVLSYFQGEDLSSDDKNIETVYFFKLSPSREIIIRDKYNKIQRSWDASSSSIITKDGLRKVIFTEPAILKTENDSINPQVEYVKVKGYMGIITEDTNFSVDRNGEINSDNWGKS